MPAPLIAYRLEKMSGWSRDCDSFCGLLLDRTLQASRNNQSTQELVQRQERSRAIPLAPTGLLNANVNSKAVAGLRRLWLLNVPPGHGRFRFVEVYIESSSQG